MFSYIDPLLFPNDCEIYKNGNVYVYPIYKNGSSSIILNTEYTTVDKDMYNQINLIYVFIRDPYARFVSGVQTFLDDYNSDLDRQTLLKIIDKYLFLNRHFSPQLFWLVNLQRFTKAKIKLCPLSELSTITTLWVEKRTYIDKTLEEYFQNNSRLHFYLQLDNVLFKDLIGQEVNFHQIIQTLKKNYPTHYKDILEYSKKIINVLP